MKNQEINEILNIMAITLCVIVGLILIFIIYMSYKQLRKEYLRRNFLVVPIEKLKYYKEYFDKVNNHELENILFTENDQDIIIDSKIISDFKFTGLNITDLILTEFYKEGFGEK